MSEPDEMKEPSAVYAVPNQTTLHGSISAREASRLANRVVFEDLVGCPLSTGEPEWVALPSPHWRVPYQSLSGELVAVVDVDPQTRRVDLTPEQRTTLLDKAARLAQQNTRA